jgi:hypothetical protein
MQLQKIVAALPALLLAGMVIGSWVSAADNADTGNQETIIIPISISNNSHEKNDLNGTTDQNIKPLNPVPISDMKKIRVPEVNESSEKQKEIFSDRDWAIIRQSMTDLTEKEQDRLITEMIKILNHTSLLSPDEQTSVSLRMGYYIINATDGGKPVNSSDLPGLPAEKPVQTATAIPLIIPLIAIGGFGIIRLLMSRKGKN